MRQDELISSFQNPKVKLAKSLWDRRARDDTGLFLIEGYRELSFALNGRFPIEMILFCPELFLGENEEDLLEAHRLKGARLFETTKSVFERLSYRDRPDGCLAVAEKNHITLDTLTLKNSPFLFIAESIEKPGNLGTILRSADASGADAVIVSDPTTDIFNPNVVRSSVGALFTVPVIEARTEESLLPWLRQNKIALVAAMPEAELSFTMLDCKQALALAVGSEQYGLSSFLEEEADFRVRIPMGGRLDSLNVASAATLLLYEVFRQRNAKT